MKHQYLPILENHAIAENLYRLTFKWESLQPLPLPGQFVTVRCTAYTDPLLRRPLAVASFDESTGVAGIIYQRRGKATAALAEKKAGDSLDIIGPLGNCFPLPENDTTPILIAGGIGLGPILFLHSVLRLGGYTPLLIVGFRTKSAIPFAVCNSPDTVFCTDDGTIGFHGTAGEYLKTVSLPAKAVLYACGPEGLLRSVEGLAERSHISCWISMEQVMACGLGACMGCVIRVKRGNGFARVCTEGPVFPGEEIVWT